MAADIKSAGECLKAVNILFEELKNAKRSLINSESCTVNRNLMQAQLEYLRDNLPDTVSRAAAIVEQEETIRTETEQKKKEILENASSQSQQMINDANLHAQQIMEQANREAGAMIDRASQEAASRIENASAEANHMLEDAEQKARKRNGQETQRTDQ